MTEFTINNDTAAAIVTFSFFENIKSNPDDHAFFYPSMPE